MGGNVRLRRVPLTLDECHLCAICSGCCQVRFKSVFTFQPPKKGRRRLIVPIFVRYMVTASTIARKRRTITESLSHHLLAFHCLVSRIIRPILRVLPLFIWCK
jgi:hypothetical protein